MSLHPSFHSRTQWNHNSDLYFAQHEDHHHELLMCLFSTLQTGTKASHHYHFPFHLKKN
ncbi:hypothetical protein HanXRQr2_Chr13g0603531 [Helianthus annuus]|uniref:Uncharacterized protein n=1 Tax=Helianthus annuus TaxID=4232 RepID=A0A9K3HDM7_HELAN|nr:hypothetical protein HanXRQr2_Chr13g0603531 [Helianthus annuus]KAJ0850498.1 hypothetical protein HanPSC8_Chr13g0581571 [Helianthus annuus]